MEENKDRDKSPEVETEKQLADLKVKYEELTGKHRKMMENQEHLYNRYIELTGKSYDIIAPAIMTVITGLPDYDFAAFENYLRSKMVMSNLNNEVRNMLETTMNMIPFHKRLQQAVRDIYGDIGYQGIVQG